MQNKQTAVDKNKLFFFVVNDFLFFLIRRWKAWLLFGFISVTCHDREIGV